MSQTLSFSYKKAFFYTFLLMIFIHLSWSFFSFLDKVFSSFLNLNLEPFLNLAAYLGGFFIFYFWVKKTQKKFPLPKIYFKFQSLKIYGFMLLAFTGMMLFVSYLNNLLAQIPYVDQQNKLIEEIIKKLSSHKITFFFSTVFLAPLLEEIFFRGILLEKLLNTNKKPLKAILFSSFLFGFIHLNPAQFVGGFVGGILFGFIYYYSKSLLNCILMHALNNLMGYLLIFSTKEKELEAQFDQMNAGTGLIFLTVMIFGIYGLKNQKINK